VLAERKFENMADLLTNLDTQLCKQLLFDILPKLSILDPDCGAPRGAIKQYLKGKEAIRKVSSMPQYC